MSNLLKYNNDRIYDVYFNKRDAKIEALAYTFRGADVVRPPEPVEKTMLFLASAVTETALRAFTTPIEQYYGLSGLTYIVVNVYWQLFKSWYSGKIRVNVHNDDWLRVR